MDIISQRQIAATGASETSQVIQALAPSFNFPRTTISDGADSIRPATLRGLAPDQVLVLVNGKRRHSYAHIVTSNVIGRGASGVDLNAIPASAIERIEILRDGAAAQYGSDAIAGVINIVLKSGAQPLTLSGKAGMTTGSYVDLTGADRDHSDGELTEGAASYGWSAGPRLGVRSPPNTATATAPTAPRPTCATRSGPATRATTRSSSPTITGATPSSGTSWPS